jgi:hypothetical protein
MVNIEVSIPIWCDYKIWGVYIDNNRYQFQFQYGAIIRVFWKKGNKAPDLFQFQYGAIISNKRRIEIQKEQCFNSNMVRL